MFTDGLFISDAIRTVRWLAKARHYRLKDDPHICGRNMAIRIGSSEVLDELLKLPHIWPGEDRCIANVVTAEDQKAVKLSSPSAAVYTSSRFLPSVSMTVLKGSHEARRYMQQHYLDIAADGSVPYEDD